MMKGLNHFCWILRNILKKNEVILFVIILKNKPLNYTRKSTAF